MDLETKKLFYSDPYQKEFEAKVLLIEGNKVILEQTCFYPEGGGQVGDTGFINDINVIDTVKEGAQIIEISAPESM